MGPDTTRTLEPRARGLALAAFVMLAGACSGSIAGRGGEAAGGDGDVTPMAGRGGTGGKAGTSGSGGGGAGGAPAVIEGAGPLPMLRLTNDEYNNTIAALLGDTTDYAASFPAETFNNVGFKAGANVGALDARKYMEAAQTIAAKAIKDLPKLVGCDNKTEGDAPCARRFVQAFGKRAYRRPLTAAEVDELIAVYDKARALELPFETGIQLVLEAILQSPKLLYRWEVPAGDKPVFENGLVKLGPYQLASRLSYLLWAGPPDDALLAAADDRSITQPDKLLAQAKRLLANPARARLAVASFHRQWLHFEDKGGIDELQKDAKAFPMWSEDVRAGLKESFESFAAAMFLDESFDHTLKGLFTTKSAFVNEKVAPIYGITDVKGAAMVKRDLDGTQRAGVFTQAPYIAVHSPDNGTIPTKRAAVIWRDVLCGGLAAVPAVVPDIKPTPNTTTRQRFEEHDKEPCAVCHKFLDPIGFSLESYDAIGQYRTKEGTLPIDPSGSFALPSGKSVTFKDAVELMGRLAESDDAKSCITRQWFRFALGREDGTGDAKAIDAAAAAMTAKGGDLREVLTALVTSKTFLTRTPEPGETP